MDGDALVREYYRALDEGDYEGLRDVLAPEFTQERGDRTFDSRTAFISFMRTDRPRFDTRHELDSVYRGPDSSVAASGRLVVTAEAGAADAGETLVDFLDVFQVADGHLTGLRTYVRNL